MVSLSGTQPNASLLSSLGQHRVATPVVWVSERWLKCAPSWLPSRCRTTRHRQCRIAGRRCRCRGGTHRTRTCRCPPPRCPGASRRRAFDRLVHLEDHEDRRGHRQCTDKNDRVHGAVAGCEHVKAREDDGEPKQHDEKWRRYRAARKPAAEGPPCAAQVRPRSPALESRVQAITGLRIARRRPTSCRSISAATHAGARSLLRRFLIAIAWKDRASRLVSRVWIGKNQADRQGCVTSCADLRGGIAMELRRGDERVAAPLTVVSALPRCGTSGGRDRHTMGGSRFTRLLVAPVYAVRLAA